MVLPKRRLFKPLAPALGLPGVTTPLADADLGFRQYFGDEVGQDEGNGRLFNPMDTASLPGDNASFLQHPTQSPSPAFAGTGVPSIETAPPVNPMIPPNPNAPRVTPAYPSNIFDQNSYTAMMQNNPNMPERGSAQIYDEIENTRQDSGQREHSLFKRLTGGMAKGAKNWDGQGGIVGYALSALGGGIGSAASPRAHENLERTDTRRKLMNELGDVQKREGFVMDQTQDAVGIHDKIVDNETRRQQVFNQDQKNKADQRIKALGEISKQIWGKSKHYKAAEADEYTKQLLGNAGLKPEDIGDFDMRDPKTKMVGGVTYQWNSDSQSFEESNLPKDGSKELVTYEITDLDGVKRRFTTTSDRAAGLVTSTRNAQMQIQAAEARQASQQTFTASQNEADRKERLLKYKRDNKIKKADFIKDVRAKQTRGDLSPAQADQMIRDFGDDEF